MHPRTKRQKDVLDFITGFVARHGYEPSYQQIALHLGVSSKAGVAKHIQALETQGLISRRRVNGSFGIEICSTDAASETLCKVELFQNTLPGEIGASFMRSEILVPTFLLGSLVPDDVFALISPDDSMIEKQICEGDIALFERRSYARRGEIVAMAYGRKILIGRIYQAGTETELRPANIDHEPRHFPAESVAVQGIYRGLLRPIPPSED